MSNNWSKILVAAVVGALLIPTSAFAVCVVTVTSPIKFHDNSPPNVGTVSDPTPLTPGDKVDGVTPNALAAPDGQVVPANMSISGVVERLSDLVVSDNGAFAAGTPGFCFNTAGQIVITLNGTGLNPGALTIPGNIDIYDSNGTAGLTINAPVITSGFAANTAQTVITITVSQQGTTGVLLTAGGAGGATGSAIRIKNLRLDTTTVPGSGPPAVSNATATVSATGGASPAVNQFIVGVKALTVATGPCPGAACPVVNAVGTGKQSSGTGLTAPGSFGFEKGTADAFRRAGVAGAGGTIGTGATGPYSQVANDISTNPTSLVLSISAIPTGVTVTFPSTINTSAENNGVALGAAAMVYTATVRCGASLTNSGAAGTLSVCFDTTTSGTAIGTNFVDTAAAASAGATAACAPAASALSTCNPKIGVTIGSISGAGTALLTAAYGRSTASGFTGDDVDTSSIPRYAGAARVFIAASPFFTITAVRTTLLYSFVSNLGGFNTGVEVSNTSLDTAIGGTDNAFLAGPNPTAIGGIKFYFFNSNGDTFTLNTDTTGGGVGAFPGSRGLDAFGRVVPGAVFAAAVSAMLTAAGKPAGYIFDGYVIAVASFTNAHGVAVVITPGGNPFASYSAGVMGAGARLAFGGPAESFSQ